MGLVESSLQIRRPVPQTSHRVRKRGKIGEGEDQFT